MLNRRIFFKRGALSYIAVSVFGVFEVVKILSKKNNIQGIRISINKIGEIAFKKYKVNKSQHYFDNIFKNKNKKTRLDLKNQVLKDFKDEKFVYIQGWLYSETEAKLAAYRYYTHHNKE